MMKSYLRYEPRKSFGVITSPSSNITFDFSGNLALTGGSQSVGVWNLRQASQVATLLDPSSDKNYPYCDQGDVTILLRSPDKQTVAVGYSTGEVRIFNYINDSLVAILRGHRSAVISLAFDSNASSQNTGGLFLVSGGADTDIFLWDLVALVAVSRFRGHKDAVTGVGFLPRPGSTSSDGSLPQPLIVSVSKDSQLKVWDPETRHCLQTILGHRTEIWCLSVLHTRTGVRVLTGSSDDQIRGYRLREDNELVVDDEEAVLLNCGSISRPGTGSDRCTSIEVSSSGDMIAAQSSGKTVVFYRLRTTSEIRLKTKRRLRRQKASNSQNPELDSWEQPEEVNNSGDSDEEDGDEVDVKSTILTDELEFVTSLRCQARIRGCAWHPISHKVGDTERLLISLTTNSLEMYQVPRIRGTLSSAELVPAKTMILDLPGHRSDVRALALSSDGLTVASCSTEGVKLWSGSTCQFMRSCSHNTNDTTDVHGTCLAFAPGGRILVMGTKEGTCQLLDTASGECLQSVDKAHQIAQAGHQHADEAGSEAASTGAAIWSTAMRPDGRGFCTGGADKMVKFWEFQESDQENGGFRATIEKQLQMESDVLCLAYNHQKSSDKLLVAIGLLDSTVKLFFDDSMKFFLSLYGHKLPVLAIDISSDGKLLVSGSADKTVKIWGLDFGDCHRSLIGHKDSVTALRFQHETHYFFTGSKDGCIKYWDADRFEQVLHLPGHKGPVWALDVSRDGSFVMSAGQDRSLRLWERGEDLVFVEEERERAIEALTEKAAGEDVTASDNTATYQDAAPTATLKSVESVRSGELLMEAVEIVEAETSDIEQYALKAASGNHVRLARRVPDVRLLGLEPMAYLLRCLRLIKQPDLEQALLVLPFHFVIRLLRLLIEMCQHARYDVELSCRCAIFLLRCHFQQIVSARALIPEVQALKDAVRTNMGSLRELVGVNLAGLRHMKRAHDEDSTKYIDVGGIIASPTVLEVQAKKAGGTKKRKAK